MTSFWRDFIGLHLNLLAVSPLAAGGAAALPLALGRGDLGVALGLGGGAANRIGVVCNRRRQECDDDEVLDIRGDIRAQSMTAGIDMVMQVDRRKTTTRM